MRIRATEELNKEITTLLEKGFTELQVSRMLNVSKAYVSAYRQGLGTSIIIKARRTTWTEEETKQFFTHLDSGLSIESIAEKLCKTPLAIFDKCRILKIRSKYPKVIEFGTKYRQAEHSTVRGCLSRKYQHARRSSKTKGQEFNITLQDVKDIMKKQNGKCYYTGQLFVDTFDMNERLSLDRLDNSKGYTKENTVICRWIVNKLKSNIEYSKFIEICNQISKIHISSPSV